MMTKPLRGRPFGGMACIYKRELPVSIIKQSDRLQLLKLGPITLINCHLPTSDFRLKHSENVDNYRNSIAELDACLEYSSMSIIVGDFNANLIQVKSNKSYRDVIFRNFIDRNNLKTETNSIAFTHRTDNSSSMLDYIFITPTLQSQLSSKLITEAFV